MTVTTAETAGVVVGPRIAFTVGDATRHAVYASGSGTKALVFHYTVAEGDADTDGIAVAANALALNGGTIDDEASNAATLIHTAVAASTDHKVDGVRPTVESAVVDGTTLTITFDEPLGTAANLANASFTVKRTRAGAEQTVSLSGTVAPAISARTVTLTLDTAVVATDTGVKVSYTVPATGTDNALADAVGNAVAAFTDAAVANASGPTVVVSSTAGTDSTYAIGETVSFTATFAESVTVTTATSGGAVVGPRIAFTVGDATRHAVYASGSGTKALVFDYTVAEGDEDTDGIAVGADALELNGGRIDDGASNAAVLTHTAVSASTAHRVDGVRPTVESAEVDGTTLTITFDEALGAAASLANASFTVKRTRAGAEQTVALSGTPSISGATVTLTLTDAVVATDSGVKVSYTVPTTGTDNALADAVGNAAAAFTDAAVANASGPTVVVSSTAGTDSTYAIGETVSFTATFAESVTVTTATSGGAVVGPRIAFTLGDATRHAVYASGSGTKALVFDYTVAEGDEDTDGIAVGVDALALNGGAIDDGASNAAVLTHTAVSASTAHRVDGVRPTVESAEVDGTTLTITFDEALGAAASLANASFTVKKTPAGDSVQTVSLSGTVAPAISARTVTLTLTDAVVATDTGVKVSYTVPTTGTDNALADAVGNAAAAFTDAAVANASGPTVVVSSTAGTDSTYAIGDAIALTATFAESVTVTTATSGGAVTGPRIAFTLGDATRHAVYASGSGTKALVFDYTVAEGDEDTDGIAVGVDALELNGGRIDDGAGSAATLTHAAVAASTDHKVDGVRPTVSSAVVDGTTLTITFDETLGAAASLANTAFEVKRTRAGSEAAVSLSGTPAISDTTLTLTLTAAVVATDTDVKVSYTVPTSGTGNKLVDAAGNAAVAFTDTAVVNASGPAVVVSSSSGTDSAYAIGDTISLTATFAEAMTVTGTPRIAFALGSATRHAVYASGTGTAALVFSYTVAAGDEDTDGIAVAANALELNGGRIDDGSGSAATLTHAAVAASTAHQVDGVRPTVESAVVDGATLTITFDEALDTTTAPDKSAFTVSGTAGATSVTGVAFKAGDATKVELTVSPAVVADNTGITLGYTVPSGAGASPLEDVPGNAVADFTGQWVTNATGPQLSTVAVEPQNPKRVALTFDKDLATPDAQARRDLRFAFSAQGFYYQGVPIWNQSPEAVAVSGPTVTLTFRLEAPRGRKFTVSYDGRRGSTQVSRTSTATGWRASPTRCSARPRCRRRRR